MSVHPFHRKNKSPGVNLCRNQRFQNKTEFFSAGWFWNGKHRPDGAPMFPKAVARTSKAIVPKFQALLYRHARSFSSYKTRYAA
jgi:hypothetical protein